MRFGISLKIGELLLRLCIEDINFCCVGLYTRQMILLCKAVLEDMVFTGSLNSKLHQPDVMSHS